MSVDKHFEKRGIDLTDDNSLPAGQRTQRNVKRLIAAVRAAESEFNDELHQANERCRTAQSHVIELTAKLQQCAAENMRLKLERTLDTDGFNQLTVSDKTRLLELTPA
jgi:hypothetical protein